MFIFIIITLFCTVNWTSCQAPLLVFPSNVDIPYSTGTANIAFSLAKAPKDDVTIFIEVKNVFFDNCNIQFEKGSWNVPQTVLATTLPYFTESDKVRSIPMRMKLFSENDPEFDQKEYTLSITRSGAAGRICTIGGDPHFLNYNGVRYDFQGLGCYDLVRSEFLVIQYVSKKWVNSAMVQKILAIQYGKCVTIYDCEKEGQPVQQWNCDGSDGVTIQSENKNNNVVLSFSEGSRFKMNRIYSSMWYCNTEVQMAGHSVGKAAGVCGSMTPDPRDKNMYDPNGNVVRGESAFGESWQCPGDKNLVRCAAEKNCKPLKKRIPVSNCLIPDVNFWEDTPGVAPADSHAELTTMKPIPYNTMLEVPPNEIPEKVPQPEPSPQFMTSCSNACDKAMTDEAANKILDKGPFVENCVSDCELTLSFDLVDGHKMSYMSRYQALVGSIIDDPSIPSTSALKKEANEAYATTTLSPTCGEGCGAHGVCTSAACQCNSGWGGAHCELELISKGPVTTGDLIVIGNRPVSVSEDPAQERHHEITAESENPEEASSEEAADDSGDWGDWSDDGGDWGDDGGDWGDDGGDWSDDGGDWSDDGGDWSDDGGDWSDDGGDWSGDGGDGDENGD